MLYIQSDLPPLGRGSGRGDRKAGNRDNPSAAATQAHAGSAFGKGCVYRQGDRTRQDRLRNRHRCYLHSIILYILGIVL